MDEPFRAAGLSTRLITGGGLAALLLAAWYLQSWPLALLLALASGLGQWEFCRLLLPEDKLTAWMAVALGTAYVAVSFLASSRSGEALAIAPGLLLGLIILYAWNKEDALLRLQRAAVILGSLVYLPILLCPMLRFSQAEQLLLIAVPVFSDSAAYFTGVRFGRHRIWPAVSPKKSVEGALAGLAAATLICCLIGLFSGSAGVVPFLLLGLALGVMAQLGDFFESALKRAVNVKDSGTLLPGHGGMLDRLDSILFTVGTYAVLSAWTPFFG